MEFMKISPVFSRFVPHGVRSRGSTALGGARNRTPGTCKFHYYHSGSPLITSRALA